MKQLAIENLESIFHKKIQTETSFIHHQTTLFAADLGVFNIAIAVCGIMSAGLVPISRRSQ